MKKVIGGFKASFKNDSKQIEVEIHVPYLIVKMVKQTVQDTELSEKEAIRLLAYCAMLYEIASEEKTHAGIDSLIDIDCTGAEPEVKFKGRAEIFNSLLHEKLRE